MESILGQEARAEHVGAYSYFVPSDRRSQTPMHWPTACWARLSISISVRVLSG